MKKVKAKREKLFFNLLDYLIYRYNKLNRRTT